MFTWLKRKNGSEKRKKVVMLGLDYAGKSSIIECYKTLAFKEEKQPTIGAEIETLQFEDLDIIVFDVGGQEKFRSIWPKFFPGTELMIFVLDAAAKNRIEEAKIALTEVISNKELKDVPFIIFANKQDLKNVMGEEEIIHLLGLTSLIEKNWKLVLMSAKTGQGLALGFQWIYETLTERKLSRAITMREIFVFNNGGLILAYWGAKERRDPLLVGCLFTAIQSMSEAVFEGFFDSFTTSSCRIVCESVGEVIGALVVDIHDDDGIARKILHQVLKLLEKGKPTEAEKLLHELVELWNIGLKEN